MYIIQCDCELEIQNNLLHRCHAQAYGYKNAKSEDTQWISELEQICPLSIHPSEDIECAHPQQGVCFKKIWHYQAQEPTGSFPWMHTKKFEMNSVSNSSQG
jgi:hypothetical protein